jgi:arylsulfatase A-like enzyme
MVVVFLVTVSLGAPKPNIVIILTDDQGYADISFNPHHSKEVRTPWILSWPEKLKGSQIIETPIVSLDILPTVMDAIGLVNDSKQAFDGKSLLPLLEGETTTLHEHLFWSEGSSNGHRAVRSSDQWKLVTTVDNKTNQERKELFNLGEDPAEENDLSSRNPQKVQELTRIYSRWLDDMADPMRVSKRWQPE